jgi:hypothetical protein
MPDRLLKWDRTALPGRENDDYTGTDPGRLQVRARVYLTKKDSPGERPWFWTITDTDTGIATGYEADVDAAIEAVDRTYAAWQQASKSAS